MLTLRPNCENCNKTLPSNSTDAMICSYECTFCKPCVDTILKNVCPNCGGGFCNRPIRPNSNLKNNCFLSNHPASTKAVYKPVDQAIHDVFSAKIMHIPAHER